MCRLIGLLGGTFDPIHYGHLRPALEIMQSAALHEIRFIPNYQPPHRGSPSLDADLRRQLIELAIADIAAFQLDNRELEREGPSYMVETLRSLREDYPQDHLCLIMGMDAFAGLSDWYEYAKIFELAHLIVTTRPGTNFDEIEYEASMKARFSYQADDLKRSQSGVILLQSVTQLDISASQIRQSLANKQSSRFLLPDIIREKLEKLYAI